MTFKYLNQFIGYPVRLIFEDGELKGKIESFSLARDRNSPRMTYWATISFEETIQGMTEFRCMAEDLDEIDGMYVLYLEGSILGE